MNTIDETQNENKLNKSPKGVMPRSTLRDAIKLAEALRDNFAGKNATPIDLAKAADRSPTSSSWRYLTGAAVAYGITDAGYAAGSISLTTLGSKIVSPTEESSDREGLLQALLQPELCKTFYEKYDGSKLPREDIAKNVLNQLGVPMDRTDEALRIILDNAKFVGVLTDLANGQYIQLKSAKTTRTGNANKDSLDNVKHDVGLSAQEKSKQQIELGNLQVRLISSEFKIAISDRLLDKALFDEKAGALLRQVLNDAKKFTEIFADGKSETKE